MLPPWTMPPFYTPVSRLDRTTMFFYPLPHSGISVAKPFRRGTAWTSSASLRELDRLRHSVELVPMPVGWSELTEGASAVSRVVQRMAGTRQLPALHCHSSSIVDHHSYHYQRVGRRAR